MMRPAVGVSMRSTASPVVDLPDPLSPTRPSVSPRRIVNETPSTALTVATWRWIRIPLVTGKWTFKSSTRRIGSSAATVVGNGSDMGKARLGVMIRNENQFGPRSPALCHDRPAARRERTARRQAREVRWLALDWHQAAPACAIEPRDQRHQTERVGMLRPGIEFARGRDFHDTPAIHHRHAIGIAGDDPES